MRRPLDRFSRLVTARPWITIVVLLLVTVVLAAGATRRLPPVEGASVAFLPPGSAITAAVEDLDEFFGESGDVSVVTLVFRGEALTPAGLAQMDALLDGILAVTDHASGEMRRLGPGAHGAGPAVQWGRSAPSLETDPDNPRVLKSSTNVARQFLFSDGYAMSISLSSGRYMPAERSSSRTGW